MKVINNYTDRSLLKRLSMMLFVALAGMCNVMAESKVYVDPFTIKPGEEKVIAVNFDNGDEIAALQMDFALPEGLSYVKFDYNKERIERGVHVPTITHPQDEPENTWRIVVRHTSAYEVIPGNGALIYLTLKADETFSSKGEISFDKIRLTTLAGQGTSLEPFAVPVSSEIGNVSTNTEDFSIKQNGQHTVNLFMDNSIDVYGMSGRITLPAGMTFVLNDRGIVDITYGDRIPLDATVDVNAETGKFAISGSIDNLGKEGFLFAFKVVASENLAESSDIKIGEIVVADINNQEYPITDVLTIKVTNSYLADFVPAKAIADGLQTKLDEAIATIAETAPDVKDTEEITSAEATIQQQITDLVTAIQAAYDNETLGAEKETVLAPATDIEAAIDQLLEDAAAAQKAYEDEQAKIAANEAANTRLTEEIAALQTKLDEAKATIDEECSDVAADFTAAEQAIQGQIDALTEQVKTAYEAVELTEESNIDTEKAAIEVAIEKLLSDAAAAQEEYNKATGIGGISADGVSGASEIYTLSGSKAGVAVKGSVNIIKTSDGSVKKVFIK